VLGGCGYTPPALIEPEPGMFNLGADGQENPPDEVVAALAQVEEFEEEAVDN